MIEQEMYSDLKAATKGLKVTAIVSPSDLNGFFRILLLSEISSGVIRDIDFLKREDEFKALFMDYDPSLVYKKGRYLKVLDEVLEHFKPERKSPYKEITQAATKVARYLHTYQTLDDYKKALYLECKDDESTLQFLLDFRKTSGLESMYLAKAGYVFQNSGLLDVPVVDIKAKEYLIPLFDLPNNNVILYKKMLMIAKKNEITCHELNLRIDKLNK
ncbi:MAG: hypothetical protein WCS80_04345 [Bacilli bacterium]